MFEPEIQDLLESSPPGVDPVEWSRLTPGERLRTLKISHYMLSLAAEQRAAAERLPAWVEYGPEHGFPPEWFNGEGFLLPKYRPGGGLHDQFLTLSRLFEKASTAEERALERWEVMTYRFGVAATILWGAVVVALAVVVIRLNPFGFASRDLRMVIPFALAWIAFHGGRTVLPYLIGRFYLRRAVLRDLRRAQAGKMKIRSTLENDDS